MRQWEQVRLGDVLRLREETPDSAALLAGETRIVAKIGFDSGAIDFRSDASTKTDLIQIQPGDLVVSGINAAKGAIAMYPFTETRPAAATIHYAAYEIDPTRADANYVWRLLRSGVFRDTLLSQLPGGIKTELRAKYFLPIDIPLPPLEEQRRIVARIDALAAKIEEARGLRQKTVQEADQLLPRALSDSLDVTREESSRLGPILAEPPRNGLAPQRETDVDGRPMLRISAVSSSPTRFVDMTDHKLVEVDDSMAEPFVIRQDDVFVVRYNGDLARVAKSAIFKGDNSSRTVYPDKLIRLRPNPDRMLPDFLVYALRSSNVRSQIEALGKTTAGQIGISGANVKSFMVCVPPIVVQRRIVAYLDGLQAKADRLKALQAETAAELDALLPSVLDRAFRGEL